MPEKDRTVNLSVSLVFLIGFSDLLTGKQAPKPVFLCQIDSEGEESPP